MAYQLKHTGAEIDDAADLTKANSASITELKAQELQSTCIVHPKLPNGTISTFENGSFIERVKKYALQASDINFLFDETTVKCVRIRLPSDAYLPAASNVQLATIGSRFFILYSDRKLVSNIGGYAIMPESGYTAIYLTVATDTYANLAAAQAALAGTVVYYQLATYNTIALPTTKTPNTQELNRLSEKDAYLNERLSYGVVGTSDLIVAGQSTPDMTVKVPTGTIYMATGTRFTPTAVTALAVTAADATNPRIDIVYVNSSGVIAYLAGTAGASPSAPSVPTGGQKLAEISVAANATTIVAASISDKRKKFGIRTVFTPTLLNSWVADTGWLIEITVEDDGYLSARGRVKSGTVATPCTNMPVGMRPKQYSYFPCLSNGVWTYISVDPAGNFNVPSTASNVYITLDAIRYKIEQ